MDIGLGDWVDKAINDLLDEQEVATRRNISEPVTYDLKKLLERDPDWSPYKFEIPEH